MNVIHMGVGGFGERWSNVLATTDRATVVALVDSSQAALDAACDAFGHDPAHCYTTLDDALAAVDAELLVCVTPPRVHRAHVTQALQAGLHVVCEKPMANTLADCVAMWQAAARFGRNLVISQNYRYRPEMQAVARLVRDGAIGAVGQIKLDFYKGWYFEQENFRSAMPHPLIVDMCIHHFDLLRFVTGLEPVTVRGTSWNPPWSENDGDTSTQLHMVLDNGARFVYTGSWCSQGDFCDWNGNWLIEGDKGSIVYGQGALTLNRTDGRYEVIDREDVEPDAMALTDQEAVLDRFITAIERGERPETDAADNLRSISAVFAAVEAVERGVEVAALSAELRQALPD